MDYLTHGGYLTAINDIAAHGVILPSTLNTYAEWLRGDMVKRGKKEHFLKEILAAIIKHYGSQITWNSLVKSLSIDHPATLIDYCETLANMDAVFIQQALIEDKLVGAPKKARKLMFCDPFIFHAARHWLTPVETPYQEQIKPLIADAQCASQLVEACVVTHIRRFYPTYYLKSKIEVDVAYVKQQRFYPIEVKWRSQSRLNELDGLQTYQNLELWTKQDQSGKINGITFKPLSLALRDFGVFPLTA